MKDQIKIGQVIAGKYELIKALKESHLYQWIGAVNLKTQKAHTLQVLVNDYQKGQIKETFDYFDALKNIRRDGIVPPEQVVSNGHLPLVIIHSESFGSVLELSKDCDFELTLKYLSEASELLHILNNKKLIHGQINPKSFILKDNKVYLSGFGYAPFLLQGNEDAIKDCGDFLPPEITDTHSAQRSKDTIDTYAFAKTVAYWFPNICTSAWYLQATNPDPNQRFKRMRNLFEELKKALMDAFLNTTSNTTETNDDATLSKVTEAEIKLEPQTSGGIIPKHILEIELDPPEAGRVEGGGKYAEGRQVSVKAIAFPDWEFIGWDGDIVQSNNTLDLVIEKNLKIIARYKKIPMSYGSIQIEIRPSEAQEFVRVSGAGSHLLGTSVNINAWSNAPGKWRFTNWTGDVNGSSNSLTISLTSDIRVVAQFAIVSESVAAKPSPKKLGAAFDRNEGESNCSDTSGLDKNESNPTKTNNLGTAFTPKQSQESSTQKNVEQNQTRKPTIGKAFNE